MISYLGLYAEPQVSSQQAMCVDPCQSFLIRVLIVHPTSGTRSARRPPKFERSCRGTDFEGLIDKSIGVIVCRSAVLSLVERQLLIGLSRRDSELKMNRLHPVGNASPEGHPWASCKGDLRSRFKNTRFYLFLSYLHAEVAFSGDSAHIRSLSPDAHHLKAVRDWKR